MLWRHLCLVRAWSAAGLLCGASLLGMPMAMAQAVSPDDPEKTTVPADVPTSTVELLKASKSGELKVVAHGQGQARIRLTLSNTSSRRLNVVIPPGLVAVGNAGQQGMGGGRSIDVRPSRPAQAQAGGNGAGLRSVPVSEARGQAPLVVPVGETLDLTMSAVCLNYGLPSPTPRDVLRLMDVDDYTTDVRVRRSLRSLASSVTSQGVAQAVMWRVCNNLPFETMSAEAGKVMNDYEIALAARFVEALDASTGKDLVDPSYLAEGRLFVRIQGEGALAVDARRLNEQLEGARLMGLPVRTLHDAEAPTAPAPALFVKVTLTDSRIGETKGRINVAYCGQADQWQPLGKATFQDASSAAVLDGQTLTKSLDRALAAAFVGVKPAKRTLGSTTMKVENRLPFTLSAVHLKAGESAGSPSVPYFSVGIGPARSGLLPIQAATATVDRIELNGL